MTSADSHVSALVGERELVDRARTDPEAFTVLYRHYLPRIHAFAIRRTSSQHVADDITAITFERALRGLDRFTWKAGGFGAWLFRIAANELIDHHRSQARATGDRATAALHRLAADPIDEPADQLDAAPSEGDREAVLDALGRLAPRYQQVLALRYLADLSPDDAALACGLSKPHFNVVLHRARTSLRRELERTNRDQP